MSAHGLLYRVVLGLRGESRLLPRLEELQRLQWSDLTTLVGRQDARLSAMLDYAYAHCPHYRSTWPSNPTTPGASPRDVLAGLSMLAKSDLQTRRDELTVRDGPRRVSAKVTGGSTGEPVTILKDRSATAEERAAMWLAYGWHGVTMGDPGVRFWGTPMIGSRRAVARLSDTAMNRIRFSAFAFTDADLERYWHRCLRFQPAYFHGYVSMVEAFTHYVRTRGYDGRQLGLKSIIVTSEVLTDPQRALISETFGAPVQSEYGSGEIGSIAFECEERRFHVMTENVALELIKEDGTPAEAGETGEIVVTDLNNRAQPLIRYRLGDFGVRGEPCPCGRGFPVLQKIWGRAYDFVQTPTGERFHGEFFMYIFEDLRRAGSPVSRFRVTQRTREELEVEVVVSRDVDALEETRIAELFRQRVPAMVTRVQRVNEIARTPSGKMQVIRNLIDRPATEVNGSTPPQRNE